MAVVIVAGGAQGAISAEWKCKQRLFSAGLWFPATVTPDPSALQRTRRKCHVSRPTVCLNAVVTRLPPGFCL